VNVRRNTIYNLVGLVIPVAVSLITVPIYLDLIGEERYGVLAIAWLLLGYFGIFDLGLGRATAQRIAALHESSAKERADVFWTALILNIAIGVVGGLLIWPAAEYFFGSIYNIDETFRSEIISAVPWLILAVPVATLSGVLVGALQGRERFLELNLISVIGTILFQLLPLATAAHFGAGLNLLIPTAIFARTITLVFLFFRCRKHISRNHPPAYVKSLGWQLISFGGWVTISSFIGPMMVILDRFIIGAISGARIVSYYTVPFQLSERSVVVSNALVSALFPRFAALPPSEEIRLATKGIRLLVCVMTPLVTIGILFMEPFLAWWIDEEFASHSSTIGQILLLGFWFNGLAKIPSVQLQAKGRPDAVAKCHLAEVLPYLGLLYFGINRFGAVGAAVVFSLRVIVDLVILARLSGVLPFVFRLMPLPLFTIFTAFLIASHSELTRNEWGTLVFAHTIATVTLAWMQAPAFLRDSIQSWIREALSRLSIK